MLYGYTRDGLPETIVDAAGTRVLTYDAATREPIGENLPNGFYGADRDIERGYHADVVGRITTLSIGEEYEAAYNYDDEVSSNATGRLSRVTGPGLPAGSGASHGAFYTFVSNSDLVDQVRYKVDGGDVRAWVARSYEAERDLVTSVESNFGDLTTYTTVSKYAYGNDARALCPGRTIVPAH
ncbi:MAG: hypothetical protein AB7Q17_14885 [Phycisphaerae bacterium]